MMSSDVVNFLSGNPWQTCGAISAQHGKDPCQKENAARAENPREKQLEENVERALLFHRLVFYIFLAHRGEEFSKWLAA